MRQAAPNASKSFTFSATLGPGIGDVKEIKNCVTMEGQAPSCATLPLGVPPPPLLTITKTSTQGGVCDLNGACTFNIVVRNESQTPVTGDIFVTDSVPGVSTKGVAQPTPFAVNGGPANEWNCSEGNNGVSCQATAKEIPPNGILTLGVTVSPGAQWKKNDILENCAVVGVRQNNQSVFKSEKACAEVKLDPFKVSIAKTGDQTCAPGSNCTFELDIFNDERIIHDDPVTVVDNLVGLESAEIVSITAQNKPFPCSPAPTKLPFSCTGKMRLEPGEHNKYTMVVKVPATAPEQGWFSNCASIGDNAPATPGPTATGGTAPTPTETACHVVSTAPQCTGGMEPTKDGKCACPPGTSWDGKSCAAPKSPGSGGAYPSMPNKEKPKPQEQKPQQQAQCPKNLRRSVPPPNCCPRGMTFSKGSAAARRAPS